MILGDSIGNGGGVGPYDYELLRTDLDDRFGGIEYVNRAQSGSETARIRIRPDTTRWRA